MSFDIHSTKDVYEICGKDIGEVKIPSDYSCYPSRRLFLYKNGGKVIGYCAVRFASANELNPRHCFVIDTFGIHESCRRSGFGSKLFSAVKEAINSPQWHFDLAVAGMLSGSSDCYVCLQSTYDYESYAKALALYTRAEGDKVVIDMNKVVTSLTGSCAFWRRMGFENYKVSLDNTVIQPVLVMWYKIKITYPH